MSAGKFIFIFFGTFGLLASCGTLTGIPAHGGGKRFSEEQRLVASSIKLSIQEIDVSMLRGKNVAIIFSLIADEGAGSIVGGRASITGLLTQGQVTAPTSSSQSTVDIFQIANTSTGITSASSVGTSASTESSNTSNNSNTTSTSTANTTGSDSSTAVTSSQVSSTANQTTTTTSNSANDETGSSTSTIASTGTQTGNSSDSNATTSMQTTTGTGATGQAVVTGTKTDQSGKQAQESIGVNYEGLGQYQNIAVPKSDASFLMSEIRNYFLLNEITIRAPDDPAAEVFVYVSVPVLGTNRSRTDLLLYNQESLRAETLIEIFAIDRTGKIVMKPQVGNYQTSYKENYVAWSGPYNKRRYAENGLGLVTDQQE